MIPQETAPVLRFPFLTSPTEKAVKVVVLQEALEDGIIANQDRDGTAVVDTLGAGDAFFAAFLVARLNGKSANLVLRAGAEFAAQLCGEEGALGHARHEDLATGYSWSSMNG